MNATRTLGLALLLATAVGPVAAQPSPTPAQRAAAEAVRDACKADLGRFCSAVRPGGGRVLACLEGHATELSSSCSAALPQAHDLRASVSGSPAK